MFDEEGDEIIYLEEGAEDLEIELNEKKPAFLQDLIQCSIDVSPFKIFRSCEGSMSHAAAVQSALTKQRREILEQKQSTMQDSVPKDLNRPWKTQCLRLVRCIWCRS